MTNIKSPTDVCAQPARSEIAVAEITRPPRLIFEAPAPRRRFRSNSLRSPTTVDPKRRPSDKGGGIGSEINDGAHDILDDPQAPELDLCETLERNASSSRNGRVIDVSMKVGAIELTADSERAKLDGHRLGQAFEATPCSHGKACGSPRRHGPSVRKY